LTKSLQNTESDWQ